MDLSYSCNITSAKLDNNFVLAKKIIVGCAKTATIIKKTFYYYIVNVVADYYFCKFELDIMQLIGNLLRYIM